MDLEGFTHANVIQTHIAASVNIELQFKYVPTGHGYKLIGKMIGWGVGVVQRRNSFGAKCIINSRWIWLPLATYRQVKKSEGYGRGSEFTQPIIRLF